MQTIHLRRKKPSHIEKNCRVSKARPRTQQAAWTMESIWVRAYWTGDCVKNSKGLSFSKFKFSLTGGDLVFCSAYNIAVHIQNGANATEKFTVLRRANLLSTPCI